MVFSKCSQVFMYHNYLKCMIVPGENSNVSLLTIYHQIT